MNISKMFSRAALAALALTVGVESARPADLPSKKEPPAPVYTPPVVKPLPVFATGFGFGRILNDIGIGGIGGAVGGAYVQGVQKDQVSRQVGTTITSSFQTSCGCWVNTPSNGFSSQYNASAVNANRIVKGAVIGGLVGAGSYTALDGGLYAAGIDVQSWSLAPRVGAQFGMSFFSGALAGIAANQWGGQAKLTQFNQNPQFADVNGYLGVTVADQGLTQYMPIRRMSVGRAALDGGIASIASAGITIPLAEGAKTIVRIGGMNFNLGN